MAYVGRRFFLIGFTNDARLEVRTDLLRLKQSLRGPWHEYQRADIGSVVISFNSLDIIGVDGRRLDFLIVPRNVGPSRRVRRVLDRHGWLAKPQPGRLGPVSDGLHARESAPRLPR